MYLTGGGFLDHEVTANKLCITVKRLIKSSADEWLGVPGARTEIRKFSLGIGNFAKNLWYSA